MEHAARVHEVTHISPSSVTTLSSISVIKGKTETKSLECLATTFEHRQHVKYHAILPTAYGGCCKLYSGSEVILLWKPGNAVIATISTFLLSSVFVCFFKVCELEQLTALYKCKTGQIRKSCLMQQVRTGQNVHHKNISIP